MLSLRHLLFCLGVLALVNALQQKFFIFWPEVSVYRINYSVLEVMRTANWPLSLINAAFCYACAALLETNRVRLRRAFGYMLLLWVGFCLVLAYPQYNRWAWRPGKAAMPPGGIRWFLPKPWMRSSFQVGMRYDPSYCMNLVVSAGLLIAGGVLAWRHGGENGTNPGFCRCGYNLTGNRSGICPECGRTLQDTQRIQPSLTKPG